MDQAALQQAADRLDEMLQHHAADQQVQSLRAALAGLIAAARTGQIADSLDWRDVPGAHGFAEGGLGQYSDLESAYAAFRIALTGGESAVLRKLRAERAGS